ncbi:oxygen-independent coproporphyrinogen III oxidase [Sandarakinorhabdus cyanobacteriorum]|uniref:Coproporphyrinogen-III oxidase n=1 Tax=Sandarakinorhabdus cyanobacteriorum TaxID=1981098 RepID=A0A255Y834_9SPHN|nr:oxygen-independent coproporphyrinogen III oxidase [Sandarakinorhabdus cyanobacteriorum]OYQ24775.1 oxygen-independent coproporphyrinogen III oxidase [Sandarakinorhabdus cyanobacteriorum]
MPIFHPDLAARTVPRYTSYPTAAQFHEGVTAADQARALAAIAPDAPIALYLHIPFCRQICWYCGCNTGVAANDRLRRYEKALLIEIATVASLCRGRVTAINFGGGSPNALAAPVLARIIAELRRQFAVADDAEIAMELDPRAIRPGDAEQLAAAGVNRISLGVQTFAPHVQKLINRIQPFAMIADAVAQFRAAGIDAINFDLMYGLPGQSVVDLTETIDQAIALQPSRVAVFGYAHMPSAIPRQRMITDLDLPGPAARFAMSSTANRLFRQAGYAVIGFDHFALPDDSLAQAAAAGTLIRNFQGYATAPGNGAGTALIGLGATAISQFSGSQFPGLIVQNDKHLAGWEARVNAGGLAGWRGVVVNEDDSSRAAIIERLLCDGEADVPPSLEPALAQLAGHAARGLVRLHGRHVALTPDGWPYARLIASAFDAHLQAPQRHSCAV